MLLQALLGIGYVASLLSLSSCWKARDADASFPAPRAQDSLEPTPPAIGPSIEISGDIFDSGSPRLAPGSQSTLRTAVAELSNTTPIFIEVFNDLRSYRYRFGDRVDLSQRRADALAEYLRSSKGGNWKVSAAIGRGYQVINGRPADRRIVITPVAE